MPVTIRALLHDQGPALWPSRYDEASLLATKLAVGPRDWNALYQQDPVSGTGGLFKDDWWLRYGREARLPTLVRTAITVDSAFKTGVANDYSVAAVWAKGVDDHAYLLDVWRDRVEFTDLCHAIHALYIKWKHLHPSVVIEDQASGQSAIQTLRRPFYFPQADGDVERFAALPVIAHTLPKSGGRMIRKEARMDAVTTWVRGQLCHVPAHADWIGDWLEEHKRAPNGAHDDQVDTTVMALEFHYGTPDYQLPPDASLVEHDAGNGSARSKTRKSSYWRQVRETYEDEELASWIERGIVDEAQLSPW